MSDYDYFLPDELIAQTPLEDRSASRLLHMDRRTGDVVHRQFLDVLELLQPGDLLIMNDTRVSALRLIGKKPTGAEVEALLLHPRGLGRFEALVRPGKRLRTGATILFENDLRAEVVDEESDGIRVLQFELVSDLNERLSQVGSVPLPPYIHERLSNPERYQTVVAKNPGSAAAPTAGLHFTPELLNALQQKGVDFATVTLDVGLDTFRPVQAEDLATHVMHGERCDVPVETASAIANCQGRVIAVGTTSVRTLESHAVGKRRVKSGAEVTSIFIRPGYEFQIVDGMFTNFHLPKTTMLMMLSAMVGRDPLLAAYKSAVQQQYRFLSFGDSMLVM